MEERYIIITRVELLDLIEVVNQRITKGFIPVGGVSLAKGSLYMQALYKPETEAL